jgi:hypothetical protein
VYACHVLIPYATVNYAQDAASAQNAAIVNANPAIIMIAGVKNAPTATSAMCAKTAYAGSVTNQAARVGNARNAINARYAAHVNAATNPPATGKYATNAIIAAKKAAVMIAYAAIFRCASALSAKAAANVAIAVRVYAKRQLRRNRMPQMRRV